MAFPHQPAFDHHDVRRVLEERRSQLTAELDRLVARIRERGADAVLEPDRGEGDIDDVDTSLVNMTHAMLRRVNAALARLRNGSYGRCLRCGGPIAEARLRAMPFAVRCRSCEAAREHTAGPCTLRQRLRDEGPEIDGRWTVDGDTL